MSRANMQWAKGKGGCSVVQPASCGSSVVLTLAVAGVLAFPDAAHAYIGPGAGITVLGALWAVIAAIVLALAGLLAWPIRVMMRRKKRERPAAAEPMVASGGDDTVGA